MAKKMVKFTLTRLKMARMLITARKTAEVRNSTVQKRAHPVHFNGVGFTRFPMPCAMPCVAAGSAAWNGLQGGRLPPAVEAATRDVGCVIVASGAFVGRLPDRDTLFEALSSGVGRGHRMIAEGGGAC